MVDRTPLLKYWNIIKQKAKHKLKRQYDLSLQLPKWFEVVCLIPFSTQCQCVCVPRSPNGTTVFGAHIFPWCSRLLKHNINPPSPLLTPIIPSNTEKVVYLWRGHFCLLFTCFGRGSLLWVRGLPTTLPPSQYGLYGQQKRWKEEEGASSPLGIGEFDWFLCSFCCLLHGKD
jgi:hypothetical protein